MDVLVVGAGPVGACCALELARRARALCCWSANPDVCPPVSGAYANCGLLVPSDATPLAAPGVLGQGLKWMLDSSSPFYIAPRPSPALARWLWLFRAACSEERCAASAPVLRALHVESARLHDELAADGGDAWRFHHGGELQVYETAEGLAAAAEDVARARAMGARVDELSVAEAHEGSPACAASWPARYYFPEDGHLDPMLLHARVAREGGAGRRARGPRRRGALARAGAGRRAGADHEGVRSRPARSCWRPGPGRRSSPAGSGCACRSSRPRATAWTSTARRTSPRCRCTSATPTWCSRRWATRCAWGARSSSPAGTCACGPGVSRTCAPAGERAIGVPADGPVRQLWRGPRPVTPDGLPVIGRVPRRDRVILATGHCMLGLSLGPVTGRLVAELAGGRQPSIDLAPLSAARWQ